VDALAPRSAIVQMTAAPTDRPPESPADQPAAPSFPQHGMTASPAAAEALDVVPVAMMGPSPGQVVGWPLLPAQRALPLGSGGVRAPGLPAAPDELLVDPDGPLGRPAERSTARSIASGQPPGANADDAAAADPRAPVFSILADAPPAPRADLVSSGSQTVQRPDDATAGPEGSMLAAGPERPADGLPTGRPERMAARVVTDPTSLGAMAQQALAAAARSAPTSLASARLVASQIAHGIRLASQQPGRSVAFRLQPEGLGSVAIRLSQGASGVSVQILLDSPPTRDLVQAGLPDLARSIAERGITVDQVQVGLASGQLGGGEAGYRDARQPALVLPPPTRAGRPWIEPADLDEPILATNRVDYRV
jgi:hypothetical protein